MSEGDIVESGTHTALLGARRLLCKTLQFTI